MVMAIMVMIMMMMMMMVFYLYINKSLTLVPYDRNVGLPPVSVPSCNKRNLSFYSGSVT